MTASTLTHLQYASQLIVTKLFGDVTSGVSFNLGNELPNGVRVTDIETIIDVANNAGTSAVTDIGYAAKGNAAAPIAANPTAYRTGTDLKAAAKTKVSSTLVPGLISDLGGGEQLTGRITYVGTAPTAGSVTYVITLTQNGKETHAV